MAPVAAQQNGATKAKRPVPPGIQTNGVSSSTSSPSPLMSAKKPPPSSKQPPNSASERSITASTVRPVNRNRREPSTSMLGRNSRNSAGLRLGSMSADMAGHGNEPVPYVVTDSYILKRHAGRPPSLVVHMHPTHFRFDGQDGMFPYKSPMKLFLEHLKSRTIPHDLLPYFAQANVPFYEGCLIVQVHDHKSVAQNRGVAKPTSTSSTVVPSSIHNYNQWLTPSPYVPFPKEEPNPSETAPKVEDDEGKSAEDKDKAVMPAPSLPPEAQKSNGAPKPKVFTVVLRATPESLSMDLRIKATSPKGVGDGRGSIATPGLGPPSTPISLVPPTPTATSMPPPAKRQKREKTELDGNNLYVAEGQILMATTAPLMLEPTKSKEETIALLEGMSHPSHSDPPPQPKTRKRTVAEMAADEAAAAEQERYMLFLDERLSSNTSGAQGASSGDGDGQNGNATFEPRFERFKVIADIKREHAEKKEQEKIKQQENDRRLQIQRQQQQQEQQQLAAHRQQVEAERVRREAAAVREAQMRQAEQQRQAMAARAAASTPTNPTNLPTTMGQPQHAHPAQNNVMANGMPNGVTAPPNPMQNGMSGQAHARFQAQMAQAQAQAASSPVIRQGTPQNMSSPMVGSAPMQQTNSGMATSPPRPASVVQNPAMSVPMAANMSARGSQQSHPSGTPRMPHSTPNMPHGTPINRPAMSATPRMAQNSPPSINMMAQNPQMGQMAMNQGMNQPNPQLIAHMAAQQRATIAQQQQQQMAQMQNGGMNANINAQGMNPQQQQQMMAAMQRQLMMQQQQQAQQQLQQQQQAQQQQQQQSGMLNQQQLAQQYAQLQSMQGGQMRQMTPQMQAQLQQMARINQMNGQAGNPMQRQMSNQMMNGNNANMQALAAMQMQQQQQQQQQQQLQQQQAQQQQMQAQQQQTPQQIMQSQISSHARSIFQKLMQQAAAKYGSDIPADQQEKLKQASWGQATQMVQQTMNQRRQQQQMMLQQQQQQQLQQQQAMQGMGGMMHQGM